MIKKTQKEHQKTDSTHKTKLTGDKMLLGAVPIRHMHSIMIILQSYIDKVTKKLPKFSP